VVGASPEQLAFCCALVLGAIPVRLVLCMLFMPRLAMHGYELELTWTSITLAPTKAHDEPPRGRLDRG